MIALSLVEAQLFRVLVGLFGEERVIPHMRVVAVCGGEIQDTTEAEVPGAREWSGRNTCLFTIVDANDEPQAVIEFFAGFAEFIDPREEEHQRFLPSILAGAGIRYVTFGHDEFRDLMSCDGQEEFCQVFGEKMGLYEHDVPQARPACRAVQRGSS